MTLEELKKEYIQEKSKNPDFMSFEEFKRIHVNYDPFGNEAYRKPEKIKTGKNHPDYFWENYPDPFCKEVKDKHYKKEVEPIDLIEAFELNFNLGNVVKYVARCNHKGSRKEDLRKALFYLKREYNDVE